MPAFSRVSSFLANKGHAFPLQRALLPAYAFGETDLYNQHIFTPGGLVDCFQKWFHSMAPIYPRAFYGCDFTKNSWELHPVLGL